MGIKKARFFRILAAYRKNPAEFSIEYKRSGQTRSIDPKIKTNILKELKIDKKAIQNPAIPLYKYNYSYVKKRLESHYKQSAALSTIIEYAKANDFYLPKRKKRKSHDREVLTTHAGELIQHDASYHMWAPDSKVKWCLITSLDDYSRFMLYAKLIENESSWEHIQALQSVVVKHGTPLAFYTDCHSIFRYVKGRDQRHMSFEKFTDDVDPQWKQVIKDCNIKPLYALSPQAKGKIERPYGWLQDHLIRTCIRENVKDIKHAQRILNWERERYNYKQIHSTTLEIPSKRFNSALKAKKSLFRDWSIPKPFLSLRDVFALRCRRFIDNYHSLSISKYRFKLSGVEPRYPVDIRIYILALDYYELRFWYQGKLLKVTRQKLKNFLPVYF
ncbi:MAG: DDE-type integrase/transposase/recombinase [Candidatus Omnitrophica bacterium]|nr:DDE-type integrase/transposase/recombinase [Candidatus Omnitrophota bacterium]